MVSVFSPKRPRWFKGAIAAGAVALLVYLFWSAWTPWRPGRAGGLVFGTIATLLFFYDGLYPLRTRLLAWPLRRLMRRPPTPSPLP